VAAPVILVVDDDAATATFVATVVEDEDKGYTVLAATGEEALQLARKRTPALAPLDRRMPDLDGREMARHLRADPRTAAIPLALMSAHTRDPGELAGEVDGWLPKPFLLAALFATFARWAKGCSNNGETYPTDSLAISGCSRSSRRSSRRHRHP